MSYVGKKIKNIKLLLLLFSNFKSFLNEREKSKSELKK